MATKPDTRFIPSKLASEALDYDPASGLLRWKVSSGRMSAGMVAGCVKKDRGYVAVRVNGAIYYAHRLAWAIKTGEDLSGSIEIDHRDGDPSNNSWSNLRLATPQQNKRNMRMPGNNTSGIKGVTYRSHRKKWQAQISIDSKCKYLGLFDSFDDAVAARRAAEAEEFGEFSTMNRIKDISP